MAHRIMNANTYWTVEYRKHGSEDVLVATFKQVADAIRFRNLCNGSETKILHAGLIETATRNKRNSEAVEKACKETEKMVKKFCRDAGIERRGRKKADDKGSD